MTEAQINHAIKTLENLLAQAMKNTTAPATSGNKFARKDKAILRGFAKKGIKNVVLMDRADPSKPFNVRPFKRGFNGKVDGWLEVGRVVKKGEHGVKGLFHESQTEELKQS